MQPVAQALDTLQGQNNCSQGLIIPVLRSMKLYIEEITFTSNLGKDFQKTMLQVKNLPLISTFLLMNSEFRRIEFLFMNSIFNESHPICNSFLSISNQRLEFLTRFFSVNFKLISFIGH